jgi:trimeric autotransporter adhesin
MQTLPATSRQSRRGTSNTAGSIEDGVIMRTFIDTMLACLLCVQLCLNGLAQSGGLPSRNMPGLPTDGDLATTQSIYLPRAVATDGIGGIYVLAHNNRIYYVSSDGRLRFVAGNGTYGFSGDNGLATSAQLADPEGISVDSAGNIYIADSGNNRIRKVTSDGRITTVAGNGVGGYNGDGGKATSAMLHYPVSVAVDSSGNIYIADSINHRIRKVTPGGAITTVAGNGSWGYGGDDGPAASAQLVVCEITVDSQSNLYIADTFHSRIRKVTPDGMITTIIGKETNGSPNNGRPASSSWLNQPEGLAVDSRGNLYVADTENNRIRKVSADGVVSTIAGNGTGGYGGDGSPAFEAQLNHPEGLAIDSQGNICIADTRNNRIRKITLGGVIITVAGTGSKGSIGDGGLATSAQLDHPEGLAVDSKGNLYIADIRNFRIRKVAPDGVISTIAGNGTNGYGGDDGPATSAQLSYISDIFVNTAENLFIADTTNHRIRRVTPEGVITTVAGDGIHGNCIKDNDRANSKRLNSPTGVALDSRGNLYIADTEHSRIRKVTPAGEVTIVSDDEAKGFCSVTDFLDLLSTPSKLAVDSGDNLYIADNYQNRIIKVTPSGSVTALAGTMQTKFSMDRYQDITTLPRTPRGGIAVDSSGNYYVADDQNNCIRKVTPAGVITIAAGNGKKGYSGDRGPAAEATLYNPTDVAVDSAGNLYIADTGNNRIRKVNPNGVITTVVGH